MIGETNAVTGMKLKLEMVNISISSNLASHDDIIGAVITLSYGEYSEDIVWDGSEVTRTVPAFINYTVTFGEISNYKTPSPVTNTALEGNSRSVSGIYLTEAVMVTLLSDNGIDLSGQSVSISGNLHTFDGTNPVVLKVAYGTTYTIVASDKEGYTTPSVETFTAGISSRGVNMIYEEIKAETLTVAVTGASSGFIVSVINADTGDTIGSLTTTNGTYSILENTNYYVTASAVSGYKAPANSSTYTAGNNTTRTITMVYTVFAGIKNPTAGLYIVDTEGYYWTKDNWDTSRTPDCIAYIGRPESVAYDRHCFFSLEHYKTDWCSPDVANVTISGVLVTDDLSEARDDENEANFGRGYSDKIVLQLGRDGYAAYYCNNYTFPSGAKGYLPSFAETYALYGNHAEIDELLTLVGGDPDDGIEWSATQAYDEGDYADSAWVSKFSWGAVENYFPKNAMDIYGWDDVYARAFRSQP